MLSPKTKRNLTRILPFGLIWLVFSLTYSLLEKGLLGDLHHYPSTGNPYGFSKTIIVTALTAVLLGLVVGAIEILYLNKLFVHKSFTKKILLKTFIYLLFIVSFLLIVTSVYNSVELVEGIFSKRVWRNTWIFFTDFSFWSVLSYIAAVIGVTLFYTEVSENLGQGVLHNFLIGKYHRPQEEERIFMFLDMKSSTTIAEQIGHVRYFEMLKEYYSDLSDSIIKYSGEIYQYVGDEVVVTWKVGEGLLNNNCVKCFFDMKVAIQQQIPKYNEQFGLVPAFKAALHIGKVTTGEIGVIKKDIIFTGDVLNTTARIQGLCNTYRVDILISDPLIQRLHLPTQFQIQALGENELRGKGEKIKLYTVQSH